ncbi:MAG: endolytic transglycosylase MltG [Bdellovibrionota bacterium]
MKKLLVLIFLLMGLVAAGGAYLSWDFAVKPASDTKREITIDVPPGSTFHSLRLTLVQEGLRIPALQTKLWNTLTQASKRLHVGEYSVDTSDSAYAILTKILLGPAKSHKLVVVEGTNIWDIQAVFANSLFHLNPSQYQEWLHDPKRLARMGVPKMTDSRVRPTLEGFLFPETYTYFKYNSAESVLDAMLSLFEKRVKPILMEHPWGATPEGRYKLLTLASIVEKESGDVGEQAIIASVYWNRIRKGMKLQADPTTIYGLMPLFDGNLHKSDLLGFTPYNTYRITGLPPTPIANPGETAIRAVVNPATTEYIFFVAKNDGSGKHIFSADYKTHARYVEEFQRKRRTASRGSPSSNSKSH